MPFFMPTVWIAKHSFKPVVSTEALKSFGELPFPLLFNMDNRRRQIVKPDPLGDASHVLKTLLHRF